MKSKLPCEALREDIVALLYEDGEAVEQSRARDHLAECVPCRTEFSGLKDVRKALRGWSLPVPTPLPGNRVRTPGWLPVGLAAAAGLFLGIGIAVAGRSVFLTSPGAPATKTASNSGQPEVTAGSEGQASFVSRDQLQELLSSQESRIQAELADLRRSLAVATEASASQDGSPQRASGLSPAAVERILKASEERQARLFESRLASLRTERDLQRQYDMAQIAAGLAYIDSRTGADAARTSELMKNLVRVTARPQGR